MKIHIVGIGGAAASYLIDIARQKSYEISGSDSSADDVLEKLSAEGCHVFKGHSATNVDESVDELWYSAAITNKALGYVEIEKAKNLKIPCLSFAEVAARFFNRSNIRVAVSGTHGKSTTTAMLGWVLESAGLNPTVALGAKLKDWGGNSRLGSDEIFVIEADEYARRFLELNPTHTIVTSCEPDHFDTYPSPPDYQRAFTKFLSQTSYAAVVNDGYPMSKLITKEFRGILIRYNMPTKGLKLQIPGRHNLLNATAVYEMTKLLGVPHQTVIDALNSFPGIERRFEFIGKVNEALIYDDYGHHSSEIKATLEAANNDFPNYKVVLIYQPHQAGRLRKQMNETAEVLCMADKVILLPVFQVPGREKEEDLKIATSEALAYKVTKLGQDVELVHSYKSAAEKVKKILHGKVLVITMGATYVWKVGKMILGVIDE